MALILSIETATAVCSVAITEGNNIVAYEKLRTEKSHANGLTLLIKKLLEESGLKCSDLMAVAISEGPGSYTGLRIGTSTAKGICYAAKLPLISVSTTMALAHEVKNNDQPLGEYLLAPMIDARRMEVYTQLFDQKLNEVSELAPKILDENSFNKTLKHSKVFFFGDGSSKFQEILDHPNANFIDDISPSAWAIGQLASKKFDEKDFVDLIYYEPNYLKEFVATKAKKLL